MKPAPIIKIAYPRGCHPHAPIGPGGALGVPFDVYEVVVQEVARLAQRLLSAQQRRAANRENGVGEQPGDVAAGTVAGAEADSDIHFLALEIDRREPDLDPHVGVGNEAEKAVEAGHQPFGGDRGGGRQAQLALVLELANPPQRTPEPVHQLGDRPVQDLALLAQADLAAGAQEQAKAELQLELADLVADRRGVTLSSPAALVKLR